jgi:hypothetical protein
MVAFEVAPEASGQDVRSVGEAGVVEGGLTFPEVGDQQIADLAVLHSTPVDQFLDGQLSDGAAEDPDGGRRIRRKPAGLAEHLVDQCVLAGRAAHAAGLLELHAVPDGDVGDDAAFGGQQQGDPVPARIRGDRCQRPGRQQRIQPGVPVRIANRAHRRGELG